MDTVNKTLVLNQIIKEKLEQQSQLLGITINTLILTILEKEFNKKGLIYVGEGRYYDKNTDYHLFESHKFFSLKSWLLIKALDQRNKNSAFQLHHFSTISNKIIDSQLFSTAFKAELEKVTIEINKHLTKKKIRKFTFPTKQNGFDYNVLHSEVKKLQSIFDRLDIDIDL